MNERIKELAKDHLITSEYTESGSQVCHKYEFDEIELEQFAELIIQKCLNITGQFEKSTIGASITEQIKEYFGVEE